MAVLIYGKRTGLPNGKGPVYDKTFRALDAKGARVSRLSNAMSYATEEDAMEILNLPQNKKNIDNGLVQFELRPA